MGNDSQGSFVTTTDKPPFVRVYSTIWYEVPPAEVAGNTCGVK